MARLLLMSRCERRESRMNARLSKPESIFAVAFAEGGEHQTALEIAGSSNLSAPRAFGPGLAASKRCSLRLPLPKAA